MKIVCNKSDLVKGVNIVSKAVPGKTTMPILLTVYMLSIYYCIKGYEKQLEIKNKQN